jgi:uncharacterized protein YdeI (YjbR/CyaY-like superfamily)
VDAVYFASAEEWYEWLERHHDRERAVLVGFHKRATGRPSPTWPQSVDEALCFGWIDGVRRRVDGERYTIRFTPRQARSHWSAANVRRIAELRAEGRMRPSGEQAFSARSPERTAQASYERREPAVLAPQEQARLEGEPRAHAFFQSQPPSYRRAALHWVVSAKREETRSRRLERLIADSDAGERVGPLRPRPG